VHHPGKTLESSAFDAIAATESSSIVTRQFARWEGLSEPNLQSEGLEELPKDVVWSGREPSPPHRKLVDREAMSAAAPKR
jgi:hypothetical protein